MPGPPGAPSLLGNGFRGGIIDCPKGQIEPTRDIPPASQQAATTPAPALGQLASARAAGRSGRMHRAHRDPDPDEGGTGGRGQLEGMRAVHDLAVFLRIAHVPAWMGTTDAMALEHPSSEERKIVAWVRQPQGSPKRASVLPAPSPDRGDRDARQGSPMSPLAGLEESFLVVSPGSWG